MIHLPRQLAWLALALLLAACGTQPGRLLLLDNTASLDEAALAGPAAPLLARGATLALVLAEAGDSDGRDFADRLAAVGMLRGGQIAPDGIGVYVSLAPRYSELRVGERWSGYVTAGALERMRQETLNPALRAGRTAEAFGLALAAIEAEIERQQGRERFIQWVVYGMIAAILLSLFGASLGASLSDRLRQSAPGRFVAWLWGYTPIARAQARRRLRRTLAAEGVRLGDRQHKAERQLTQLDEPPDLRAALAALAARRAPLEQAEDLAGLRLLIADYDAWSKRAQALIDARAALRGRAAAARKLMGRLRADMQRPAKPTRNQRKRGPPRPISDEDRQGLGDLEARLAELDAGNAALARDWPAATDRLERLSQLRAAYEALEADTTALWKAACPEAHAADAARRRAASSISATDSTSTYSASSYASSDSSSSSPGDYSSGSYDSGGESRAGGDW